MISLNKIIVRSSKQIRLTESAEAKRVECLLRREYSSATFSSCKEKVLRIFVHRYLNTFKTAIKSPKPIHRTRPPSLIATALKKGLGKGNPLVPTSSSVPQSAHERSRQLNGRKYSWTSAPRGIICPIAR